ncbi:MAG: type II toxin-antitoxin system VapC family toxin [Actinobacteria bacterium]|nr:type II toxin-antitoxin system VapC family toxin [Actinomycetota bacterium]
MVRATVVDASTMVDLLVGSPSAGAIRDRLRGRELHAPAHFDAEVLSALGRLHRGSHLSAHQVAARVQRLADAPIERHLLAPLLAGAWKLRHNLRLVDAVYVELATQLGAAVVTTDAGLAAATPVAEHVPGGG